MSDANETREAYVARMIGEGNSIHLPEDGQLLIDLDSADHIDAFWKSFAILNREMKPLGYPPLTAKVTPSKSGMTDRQHVRLTLPWKLTAMERIAWQAALGSDPVREILSCLRAQRGDAHPTLLVEGPNYA